MKNTTSSMTSMRSSRRKVIADSKNDRDAAGAASDQNELLDSISTKLDDVQVSNELIAEVIEQKGNGIIDAVDNVAEGSELTAEAVEKTTESVKELTSVSSMISDKLSKLTSLLEQKFQSVEQKVIDNSKSTDTALAVIQDKLPEIETPEVPSLPERILPDVDDNTNKPDEDFFPTFPEEPRDDNKGKSDQKERFQISNALNELIKTTKGGFKSTVSITDKISSMLFKYTVSALAETAKMAGMIFAIVLGIDLLRIHFDYWTNKFMSNFDAFSEEAGEWGSLLQSIFGMLGDIKKFWEAGDWAGLAGAIIKGLADVIYNLSEIMSLGISKISAAILNALGFENAALTIKGAALEGFQERTGNSLSPEDQDTLAKYQSKRIEEGPGVIDKFGEYKTRAFDWVTGRDNKADLSSQSDQDNETAKLKAMKPEEREDTLKKNNEARAAIIRFEKYLGDVDPDNPTNMKSLDKAYESMKNQVQESSSDSTPATKKELEARFLKAEAGYKKVKTETKVEPAPPSASEDNQKVVNIQKNEESRRTEKPSPTAANNVNAQINNVSNTKNIHNVMPVTATPAPGIFGGTGVN
ncbi:tape measure protein [Citrobacter phage CkP1]|nr:tape measure protein [Citrobacter phage CkP1]